MDANLASFMQRVDPEILGSMEGTENFEAVVENIYEETQACIELITGPNEAGQVVCNTEYIAYLFTMQNQAITRLIEEVEELRPAIRFITSILLGNEEPESDEDV